MARKYTQPSPLLRALGKRPPLDDDALGPDDLERRDTCPRWRRVLCLPRREASGRARLVVARGVAQMPRRSPLREQP